MTINGRLLLLVVATGLFVRVWTANDRPRPRAPFRSPDRISGMVTGPHPDSVARRNSAATATVSLTTESVRCAEEYWTATDSPIPMPVGLAAGSYRVVNDSGRVAHLEVAPSAAMNLIASAPVANPEFYVVADASSRWYFIRLRESVASEPEIPAPQALEANGSGSATFGVSHRPFTNRKFDFTGYVDAHWLEVPLNDAGHGSGIRENSEASRRSIQNSHEFCYQRLPAFSANRHRLVRFSEQFSQPGVAGSAS